MLLYSLFFFNATATPEIYTLSLHDALPISDPTQAPDASVPDQDDSSACSVDHDCPVPAVEPSGCVETSTARSEEHTSELQSQSNLVCRLLLEKKKKKNKQVYCDDRNNQRER